MRFALEAGQPIRIEREDVGQHFERDVAIQFRVACAIDVTHPTATERGQNLVVAQVSSDQGGVAIVGRHRGPERARGDFPGRRGQKISGLIVGGEQPLDLTSQRLVLTACRLEERTSFTRRTLQRRLVDLLDPPPLLGRHAVRGSVVPS